MSIQSLSPERRDLWYTRLYYFFFYGHGAFALPFNTLFLLSVGLSGTEVGWLTSINAVIVLFAAPYWANRYDSWKHPHRVLQLLLFFSAVGFFIYSQQVTFVAFAIVMLVRGFIGAGLLPISDVMAITVTRAAGVGFGSVRVFGSLAWVFLVIVAGAISQRFGLQFSQIGAGVLTLFSVFALMQIRTSNFTRQATAKTAAETEAPELGNVLQKLIAQPMLMGLAVMTFIIYIANTGVMTFQYPYLSELGASEILISIAGTIPAVVELPCMIWADRLMQKRDPYKLLMVSMLLYVIMRLGVLLVPTVATILMAQALMGVSYSFLVVGIVRFVEQHSTPREARSLLALFNVTIVSLTAIISAPLTGAFFDQFGTRGLYGIAAAGYVLGFLALYLGARFERRIAIRPNPVT